MCRLRGPCQIIILIYLMIQHPGYAKRPVVKVIPNYNKILTGEKIMMTCDVESNASGCSWYHENILIYTGKDYVISMTEIRHSGDYQCQNSAGERSEIVTLNVTTGEVILQAPVYIYEGDDVSLRCHSPYPANQTIFYKNNQMIQNNDSDLLPIKSTDLTSTYRCSKQFLRTFYKTYSSDDTSITYTEGDSVIFTPEYNKLLTGENITMTFIGGLGVTHYWYKDNEKVAEGWSYRITSAQVGHSGVYDCRAKSGNSAKFRLDVSDGPVILQAPPLVYRGSDMVLRCHSRPGYRVINTTFYKDGNVIQPSTNDLATVIIPRNQQVGRYRCTRTLSWEEYVTYTDEVSLHIRGFTIGILREDFLETALVKHRLKKPSRDGTPGYPYMLTTPAGVRGAGENHKVDYTTVNIIRLAVSGCVLFMACVFLIHHTKTEVITPSKG
ncbi:Fc receptor-like protein 5 isoform X1 [Aquarana catesbeiana]|uniref:Fc receptor-like protein 5 isoform X1 n=1 Tax=Aquarana catesbeiana TaxID=8400 RepID=UPI003CC9CAB6